MRNFSKDRGGRDFNRRPQEMHKTICSSCGKECEVPFKPSGNKPVFCRECFQTQRPQDERRSEGFNRRPNFDNNRSDNFTPKPAQPEQPNYKMQFENLNAKLDKILNMLTPQPEKVKEVKVVETPLVIDVAPQIVTPEVKVPVIKKRKTVKK